MNDEKDDKDDAIIDPAGDPARNELEPPSDRPPPDEPKPPPIDGEEAPEEPVFEHAYTSDPRNEIYARRSEQLADEQAASDQLFDEAAAARDESLQTDAAAAATALANQGEKVKVRVYGEEREVSRAEVEEAGGVVAYQKTAAADQKFRQVAAREADLQAQETRLLRITENLRRGLDEQGQPIVAAQPPAEGAARRTISKEKLESAAKGLYSGSVEEATAALQGITDEILQSASSANPVSPDIVKSVTDTVLANIEGRRQAEQAAATADVAERDRREANRIFVEDFPEITKDRDTFAMAKGLGAELSIDPEWSGKGMSAIAKEVGTRIRTKLAPVSLDANLTNRRNAKRDLSRSAAGGRQPPPAEKRFPSNQDYISQLQANSGSNSAPRR